MEEIFYFEGNSVRFVGNWENPEWIAQDVCNILGIVNYRDALLDFDDDEKGVVNTDTLGGTQSMLTVKEPGLYRLIFRSGKPIAKRFRQWIAKDVLPSIRKTGSYSINQKRGTYWYKRQSIAMSSTIRPLPAGYFSAYLEMIDFFMQLENYLGYVLPDKNVTTDEYIVPDISVGRGFNDFLRSVEPAVKKVRLEYLGSDKPIDFRYPGGKDNNQLEYYQHIYPKLSHGDNNKVDASAYPMKYRAIFDYYFRAFWIPQRFPKYLGERDADGMNLIKDVLDNLPSGEVAVLKTTYLGGFIKVLPPSS